MFSRRSALSRLPNRLARAVDEFRRTQRPLLDLTISNPTQCGLPFDSELLRSAFSDPAALRYEPEPFGSMRARETLAAELSGPGRELNPERLLLTASTSEAYGYAFKLLCDAGDEILVPAPSYPLFEYLTRFEEVRAVPYRLVYDGAWHVDLESMRNARSPRTRGIVVVSPNNPTGSYLKRDELGAISKFGLPLISDEVFSSFPLVSDERRAPSAALAEDVLTLCMSGLSKLAAQPQMKLAWTSIAGPAALVDEALARLELIADAYLSPSTPVQVALPQLLSARAVTTRALMARLSDNLRCLQQKLAGSATTPLFVEGGWYAVLRLPATHGEEAWVLSLLEQDSVLVQPGWFYDFETEPFVVLSLISDETTFANGVERIRARTG